jgi:pimeloyl-ACP methyl ester carboxylesterase
VALADALRPWSASLTPVLRQLVERELDAATAREQLPQIVDGAASFVERLARERPAVVVLDDLQWADEAVLELLGRLARIAPPAALLVIGCHRDVERDAPLSLALADLRRRHTIEHVRVDGLDRPAVESIVSAWSGRRDVRELAGAIRERTEGNPLFIEELLLHLSDAAGDGARGGPRLAIDQLSVPEGVKDLIGRRLARLSSQCNSVLTVAAVVGRAFDLDSLRRASDLETGELLDALEEAQSARIVEEVPNNVGRYTFSHALVHETLYDELTTTRRVHLHGQTLRYADSDGAKLAFEVLGSSGPYLIAIGLANCPAVRPRNRDVRRHWDRIAQSCQLILYDRRGLGFSSAPERGYGLQASVADVRAVLEAAGAPRAFLLGAVDGGPVALSLAVQYPECVAALILISTTARLTSVDDFQLGVNPDVVASFLRTEAVDRARAASAAAGTRHGAADAQAIGEVLQRVPPHAWSKIIGAYGSSDARSILGHVRVPTLILHDPENEFISVEAARYLHEQIPGSELEITTDCRPPHFGDRYYERIAAFIHDALVAGGAGPRGE